VEVLVRDHAIDVEEVAVGGGLGSGEQVLGVEDVEPLVLHRPGVKVADRDDHVLVEVELESEALLIPLHRALERLHGEGDRCELARFHVEREPHAAPRARDEFVFERVEPCGHQREQVAGLGERVAPAHPVASFRLFSLRHPVAVREQHRKAAARGVDGGGVARHHVGPVEEAGDAAEALRLALGEIAGAGRIQPFEPGVVFGVDEALGLQREGIRHLRDDQPGGRHAEGIGRERPAVQTNGNELDVLRIEGERRVRRGRGGIAPQRELCPHPGALVAKVEVQIDLVDQEGRRRVVLQADGAGSGFAHLRVPCGRWRSSGEA